MVGGCACHPVNPDRRGILPLLAKRPLGHLNPVAAPILGDEDADSRIIRVRDRGALLTDADRPVEEAGIGLHPLGELLHRGALDPELKRAAILILSILADLEQLGRGRIGNQPFVIEQNGKLGSPVWLGKALALMPEIGPGIEFPGP